MLKLKVIIFFLFLCHSLQAQNFTISGYVEDVNTGERIIGAYVTDSISKGVTQTNNYGFYILKNIRSRSSIRATYIGFESKAISLTLAHDTVICLLIKSVMELGDVFVTSPRHTHTVNAPLGLITIPVKQLTSMPALGEPDLIKSIQSQPGIKGGVEGSAGIFVRGGGAGENLFMLDDVPLYNVSHLYGFFSTFNSNAIKDVKLLKGCFPAKYGGRVSSVIDVRSLDGNNKSIKGVVSLGIISSGFTLEGPLFSNKTTFLVSGRRSYFDLYSGALKYMNLLDNDFPGYYFYDLSARLTHTFSQKDKILISIYKGQDRIKNKSSNTTTDMNSEVESENTNETSGWGNFVSSFRWNHTFGNSLFVNTTIAFSRYNYFTLNQYKSFFRDSTLKSTLRKNYSSDYTSDISDIILKSDFDLSLSNKQKLIFGLGNTIHKFNPGQSSYSVDDRELHVKTDSIFTNHSLSASEPFIYIEDEISMIPQLKINAGLRVTGIISGKKTVFNAEPRLSASYSLHPNLVFKAGYSRMVQYMHLLTSSGLSMPTDIWVPALKGVIPLKSDQINAGISFEWEKKALLTAEVYQKWLSNTADYRNGTSMLIDMSPWYDKITQGHGNAKGIELSVEKQEGRLTGSINYTLSTATRQYTDLNNGQIFPFKYDRLHDLNISVNFKISQKWDISVMWVYGTGYRITVPVEKYSPVINIYTQVERPWLIYYYPSINNVRLPDYHRLDMGIHYKSRNRLGEHTLSIDVFNAYDRNNAVSIYFWDGYSFKYNYLFPIIPSISYTLKFG